MSQALFPTRWKRDRPPSIERFMADFPDDYACAEHLARKRWPNGFVCPLCKSTKGWRLEARPWVFQCGGRSGVKPCRKQTSVIAGTVMHGTHLPLRTWFIAAYLVATHSNAISALQLQSKLGLGSYKTAWLLLHKLRRAMVNPDRTPRAGEVEVDETSIPFRKKTDPITGGQGKSTVGKVFVIGAVERLPGNQSGRIRLQTIAEDKAAFIHPFVTENTAKGCELHTDGNNSYLNIPDRKHFPVVLGGKNAIPAHIPFARIHRVFSNLKRWGLGTFHGFRAKHMDAYLNEFVFRWNRKRSFQTAMDTLLGIGQKLKPTTYRNIVGDTSEWRRAHQAQILKMVSPSRLSAAKNFAAFQKIALIDALEEAGPLIVKRPRTATKRPVLPPRRRGDPRPSARPGRRPRLPREEIEAGWLRHLRSGTPITR
jgi:hypothetical protein